MSSKTDFYCGSCSRRKSLVQLAWTRAGVSSCTTCDARRREAVERVKKQGYTG